MLQGELLAEASFTFAPDRLRVFEVLLDAFVHLTTLVASKGSDLELRLDFCRPSDRSLD